MLAVVVVLEVETALVDMMVVVVVVVATAEGLLTA